MPFLRHPQPRARVRAEVEAVLQVAEEAGEEAEAGERIAVRIRDAALQGLTNIWEFVK